MAKTVTTLTLPDDPTDLGAHPLTMGHPRAEFVLIARRS